MSVHGGVRSYRASRTLPLRVELARQLRRRRTQLTLGLLALLPWLLLLAFQLGSDSTSGRQSGQFVDLATTSGANFALFALFASVGFLFVVVIALFFGDTIASEASWSSLKYLLSIPVPRRRLLRQKALIAAFLSTTSLLLLCAMALLVGVLFYGSGPLISPTGQALALPVAVGRLAFAVLYLAVQLSWVAALALLLSVCTDAPLGAVGGAVLVSILSQILNQITALGASRQYLPTHQAYAWSDLLSSDIDFSDITSGIVTSLSYALVFAVLAVYKFDNKDITS